MSEQKEKTIEQIVAEVIEPKLKKSFDRGIMAGYDGAISIIYEHCKSMTNANQIKKYLQSKVNESKNRIADINRVE